jgi:hypothetical protein
MSCFYPASPVLGRRWLKVGSARAEGTEGVLGGGWAGGDSCWLVPASILESCPIFKIVSVLHPLK